MNEGLLLAFCAVALIAPFILRPDPSLQGTHTQLFLPPCIFFSLSRIPCPFCGATTSFTLLAHGRWLLSVLANPWGPVFALYTLIVAGFLAAALLQKKAIHLEVKAQVSSFLILLIVLWTLKLLVWYGRAWFN